MGQRAAEGVHSFRVSNGGPQELSDNSEWGFRFPWPVSFEGDLKEPNPLGPLLLTWVLPLESKRSTPSKWFASLRNPKNSFARYTPPGPGFASRHREDRLCLSLALLATWLIRLAGLFWSRFSQRGRPKCFPVRPTNTGLSALWASATLRVPNRGASISVTSKDPLVVGSRPTD